MAYKAINAIYMYGKAINIPWFQSNLLSCNKLQIDSWTKNFVTKIFLGILWLPYINFFSLFQVIYIACFKKITDFQNQRDIKFSISYLLLVHEMYFFNHYNV